MFFGEFRHSLDDKGRLTLPAEFRGELAGGAVIAQFAGPSLHVYPKSVWDELVVSEVNRLARDPGSGIGPHTRRALNASARELRPDAQGRVVVAPEQRSFAGLERGIAVVGNATHVEIWAGERWQQVKAEGEADLAQAYAALDL